MIDVVIRYGNETAFFNRMAALGVPAHIGDKPDGGKYRKEDLFSHTTNGEWPLVDKYGNNYVCARLTTEDAGKLPNNDHNPAFAIIHRSDERDAEGNPLPRPFVDMEKEETDADGNPTGVMIQYTQEVGLIS